MHLADLNWEERETIGLQSRLCFIEEIIQKYLKKNEKWSRQRDVFLLFPIPNLLLL